MLDCMQNKKITRMCLSAAISKVSLLFAFFSIAVAADSSCAIRYYVNEERFICYAKKVCGSEGMNETESSTFGSLGDCQRHLPMDFFQCAPGVSSVAACERHPFFTFQEMPEPPAEHDGIISPVPLQAAPVAASSPYAASPSRATLPLARPALPPRPSSSPAPSPSTPPPCPTGSSCKSGGMMDVCCPDMETEEFSQEFSDPCGDRLTAIPASEGYYGLLVGMSCNDDFCPAEARCVQRKYQAYCCVARAPQKNDSIRPIPHSMSTASVKASPPFLSQFLLRR